MATLTSPAEFTLERKHKSDRRSPVRWIISHAFRHWWLVIIMLVGAIGNAALAAFVPIYTGQAFNDILSTPPITTNLLNIALLIGGTQLLRGALQLGRNFGAELIAQKVERDIRDELYISLLGKSMTFHNLQPVGDTMARATNDVREVNYLFSPGVNLVIGSLIFIVMPFIYAPRYHPSLILAPALFTIIYFVVLIWYLRKLQPITENVRQTFGQMNTHLAESLDGIEVMKGAAQESTETQRFSKNAGDVRNAMVAQGDLEARLIPLLLLVVTTAGGLLHAVLLFNQGLLSAGDVVAFFGLLMMLEFPTWASVFAYSQISLGVASARRILDLMNRETNLDQNVVGHTSSMKGQVEFRNVHFRYNENTDDLVLDGISFSVEPGQTVAIVGQTGAGKTSLVKLINRTYDAAGGHVLVDGIDVREWKLDALRSQISIIEQDIFLFSRTISENIAFGNPNTLKKDIQSAAQAAQADEFIATFEKGLDTVIGERGITLSGGQRQRLALARAFLTNPKILILDDSTSAIDSATEDKIQRAISAAAEGRTTFIITHRLSQIRWADLIIVLRKGRIAAIGKHEDLMVTSEAYRRIFSE